MVSMLTLPFFCCLFTQRGTVKGYEYGMSKLANILFTRHLNTLLTGERSHKNRYCNKLFVYYVLWYGSTRSEGRLNKPLDYYCVVG